MSGDAAGGLGPQRERSSTMSSDAFQDCPSEMMVQLSSWRAVDTDELGHGASRRMPLLPTASETPSFQEAAAVGESFCVSAESEHVHGVSRAPTRGSTPSVAPASSASGSGSGGSRASRASRASGRGSTESVAGGAKGWAKPAEVVVVELSEEWGEDATSSSDDDLGGRFPGRAGHRGTRAAVPRGAGGAAGNGAAAAGGQPRWGSIQLGHGGRPAQPDGVEGVKVMQVSGEWAADMSDSQSEPDADMDNGKRGRERRRVRVTSADADAVPMAPEEDEDDDEPGFPRLDGRNIVSQDSGRLKLTGWRDVLNLMKSRNTRFIIISVLNVSGFIMQIWVIAIYIPLQSKTAWILLSIEGLASLLSGYITFHDADVVRYLHRVRQESNWCTHKLLVSFTFIVFGLCQAIQVKRAWARQLYAAEVMTEEDDDGERASSAMQQFGGAERALPVALITGVPFLLVNSCALLTSSWVWEPRQIQVMMVANFVTLILVGLGVIEIDVRVSTYVLKRYHLNPDIRGSRAGRFQWLYPFCHQLFRMSEVSWRVSVLSVSFFISSNLVGKELTMVAGLIDFGVCFGLLNHYSPNKERVLVHSLMALLFVVADLAHFVDQPNFAYPAQQISFWLYVWRSTEFILTLSVGAIAGHKHALDVGVERWSGERFDQKRFWFMVVLLVTTALLFLTLRHCRPIRAVGDDLHTAARTGQISRVYKLLQPDKSGQVLDVNAKTKDSMEMTPAMFAAESGHIEVLRMLIKQGADLNLQNCQKETVLHLAARRGQVDACAYLLGSRASLEISNANYEYPFDVKPLRRRRVSHATAVMKERQLEELFSKYKDVSEHRRMTGMASKTRSQPIGSQPSVRAYQNVPAPICASVQLRGLFPDAADDDTPSPRALHSVSGLVFAKSAGVFARVVLARASDEVGTVRLGALKKVGELGRGGFGHVIEVELPPEASNSIFRRQSVNRRFALKLQLKQQSSRNLSAYSEVFALRTVHHPFIVRLERAFQTPKFFALLLELCPTDLNRILCETLDENGRCIGVPEKRCAKYMAQVMLALGFLHEGMEGWNMVYRDVKPENILISAEDDAKLTDFGLAKVVTSADRMEMRQTMCGTMGFVPPEMFSDEYTDDSLATLSSRLSLAKSGGLAAAALADSLQAADTVGGHGDGVGGGERATCSTRRSSGRFDIFKMDTYSFGVTLQVTLLGEDGAQKKEVRRKGEMLLPLNHSEEENRELLRKLTTEKGRSPPMSEEAYDLLVRHLLPCNPAKRFRLFDPEVVNHPFWLTNLGCEDVKLCLMGPARRKHHNSH